MAVVDDGVDGSHPELFENYVIISMISNVYFKLVLRTAGLLRPVLTNDERIGISGSFRG